MADIVKQILANPIQVADQVIKAADEAISFKQECAELKSKTEKLAGLLRQAARASSDLYERPTRRIILDTEQVLEKALSLVLKCRANGIMKRVFTIIPAAAFRKMLSQLESSIGDVSWLLRVSAPAENRDDGYLGLPPIAANEPILCLIWEQIAILSTGSLEDRSDAAASLVSLARDNDRYGKLIIEEGGIGPLLKLIKEGQLEGQENAAKAIGLLGRDPESVEHMIHAGVCSAFAKILKEGPMKVQAVVAWAVSELHSKYTIAINKGTSIHAVVVASNNSTNSNGNRANEDDKQNQNKIPHPMGNQTPSQMYTVVTNTMAMKTGAKPLQQQCNGGNQTNQASNYSNGKQNHQHQFHHQQNHSLSGTNTINKGRELEDPATKANMKAMAARALWQLAKGTHPFAKGTEDVQYNSAMALMEITAVAEKDAELRRSAFKPNSPACKAVVDQLLKIIEKADSDLLLPCIKAIGNLARTFRATETRMIGPLVKLLDEREAEISRRLQLPSQNSEELAKAEVLTVLEWASKQSYMTQDDTLDTLLQEAKRKLELYQSRGSRGSIDLNHKAKVVSCYLEKKFHSFVSFIILMECKYY
ncbi:hypothetical protein FNV43_RR18690 [Rhamnella rubrinervis]|uniref:DUF7792 domain-containing protein n=1 Tax=Rhamnella rubrinervis TaxID=2594499 RepID=A0A8K0E161_9ROSA|nr:hypothetical protein FNV43_RR18690 [Rhamnella rubrinervis]